MRDRDEKSCPNQVEASRKFFFLFSRGGEHLITDAAWMRGVETKAQWVVTVRFLGLSSKAPSEI